MLVALTSTLLLQAFHLFKPVSARTVIFEDDALEIRYTPARAWERYSGGAGTGPAHFTPRGGSLLHSERQGAKVTFSFVGDSVSLITTLTGTLPSTVAAVTIDGQSLPLRYRGNLLRRWQGV